MFIYCDISGQLKTDKYWVIGSTWIKKEQLPKYEEAVISFRLKNKLWGEIKWEKITPQKLKEYKEFVDISLKQFSSGVKIIIRNKKLYPSTNCFANDGEMLSSFCYLLISRHLKREINKTKGISSFDILIDEEGWMRNQSINLKSFLEMSLVKGKIKQSINHLSQCDSKICSFPQFCDLIIGAVSAKLNQPTENISKDRQEMITYIENVLKCSLSAPTLPSAEKFNLWLWRPTPSIKSKMVS